MNSLLLALGREAKLSQEWPRPSPKGGPADGRYGEPVSNPGYRFLLTPRWIALLVIALLTVPGCLWLAGWQFDRLHDAEQENSQVRDNAKSSAVAVR